MLDRSIPCQLFRHASHIFRALVVLRLPQIYSLLLLDRIVRSPLRKKKKEKKGRSYLVPLYKVDIVEARVVNVLDLTDRLMEIPRKFTMLVKVLANHGRKSRGKSWKSENASFLNVINIPFVAIN